MIRDFLFGAGVAGVLLAGVAEAKQPVKDQLVFWLKADSGLATNGATWADQSGQGHDATAIAGEAPTYVANAINGLPAAQFSGGQAMTIAGKLLTSEQYTIIAEVIDTGFAGGSRRDVISNWSQGTGPESIFMGTITSTVSRKNQTPEDKIRFTDSIGGVGDKKNPEGGEGKIKNPGSVFEFGGVSATSTAFIFVNGKTVFTLPTPVATSDLTMPWFIGQQGAANVEFFVGRIAEIPVYNKALSAAEIKQDTAYLKKKWL